MKTDEGVFDSVAEYKHWLKLKSFQEKGWIRDLQRQVPYVLIPNQYKDGKLVEKSVKYIADFVYWNDGVEVVEDVKGYKTDVYILKRKLMFYIHNIRVQEISVK